MGLILVLDGDGESLASVEAAFAASPHRVLTAEDGDEALALVRAHPPDIVLLLLDVRRVQPSGVEPLLQPLLARSPVPTILLASFPAYVELNEAMGAAALDFGMPPPAPAPGRGRYAFRREAPTVRELEVARLAAQGLTNAEIAARLHISINTVKTHVSRILAKLGCRRRVDLVRRVRRPGAAPPGAA